MITQFVLGVCVLLGLIVLATRIREKKPESFGKCPMVTSMDSDDFVEFALSLMDDHERARGAKNSRTPAINCKKGSSTP